MSKVDSLKKIMKKVTGRDSNNTTVSKVLDDFAENYDGAAGKSYKIASYESEYTTTAATTRIPINIEKYNKDTDYLIVYVNRLRAIPTVDYTVSDDGDYIDLTQELLENQVVNFSVVTLEEAGD